MLIDDMDFAEDEAFLIKPNGTRIKIMAEIQTRTAYISDIETPIQIGDLLERPRGGVSDTYEVVNILPWSKADKNFSLIPPHIQASIIPYRKKDNATSGTSLSVSGNITASTVVISSGNNSLINISSNHNNFNDLLKAIEDVSAPQEIVESVKDLEANVGKSSFKTKYNDFISSLANHVTVLQAVMPFLPWLSNL
ncbi:MAG: hypothetical protein JFR38_07265 [Muribaculaceae bacterium]|nr:hypothetical protein [Muribaculaceae bacterium]